MAERATETKRRPDMIPVGPSVRLVSLPALSSAFRVSEVYAKRFLAGMGVPCERVYGVPYFNMFSLESVLFSKLLPDLYTAAHGDRDFRLYLQTVAALEYCSTDEKAMKRRLMKIANRIVCNTVSARDGNKVK